MFFLDSSLRLVPIAELRSLSRISLALDSLGVRYEPAFSFASEGWFEPCGNMAPGRYRVSKMKLLA